MNFHCTFTRDNSQLALEFSGLPPALIEKKKRYCYAMYAAFFSLVCGGVPQILRHIVNYLC